MIFADCIDELPVVESLDISDNHLTDLSLHALVASITRMPLLRELNLSRNKIDGDTARSLAAFLSNPNTPLISLLLRSADIDDFECDTFVRALHTNVHLRELDLSSNLIGSAENLNTVLGSVKTGGETLADFFASSTCHLNHVNLAWNSIRLDSAMELMKSIAVNSTLTFLDLRYCTVLYLLYFVVFFALFCILYFTVFAVLAAELR